jgi:hypothetical protein
MKYHEFLSDQAINLVREGWKSHSNAHDRPYNHK